MFAKREKSQAKISTKANKNHLIKSRKSRKTFTENDEKYILKI